MTGLECFGLAVLIFIGAMLVATIALTLLVNWHGVRTTVKRCIDIMRYEERECPDYADRDVWLQTRI